MKRIVSSRIAWVALALAFLSALVTWKVAQATAPLPPPFDQVVSQVVSALKPRQYYLTRETVEGSDALTACAAGYHMASLWEIFDTSNLRYNTNLGFTREDSGSGPPTGSYGWIRTGYSSSSNDPLTTIPGVANCSAWTTNPGNTGTVAEIPISWNDTFGYRVDPWQTTWALCAEAGVRVWCVSD